MSNGFLQTPILYLKGVGPVKADLIKKELGIFTFEDLLFYFPYRHIDRSKMYRVSDLSMSDAPYVQLKGKIGNFRQVGQGRGARLHAQFGDGSGYMELVWFQGIKWVRDQIKPEKEYVIFGKPSIFNRQVSMVHPSIDEPDESGQKLYLQIQPLYNTPDKLKVKGIDSRSLMKLCNTLVTDSRLHVQENLPPHLLKQFQFISRTEAVKQIHFPENIQKLNQAKARLKFEELFFLQLKLLSMKKDRQKVHNGIRFEKVGELFNRFYKEYLSFDLTDAQKRVVREIRNDLKSGIQMNRLLQGDVGSGKTVVALLCMLIAADNGFQSCLMAPTEILAQQHFHSLSEQTRDLPIQIRLLTGSTPMKERRVIWKEIQEGQCHILIGTHALIEDTVQFKSLGLAIIDEQHRFGVEQRAALWKKNAFPPHVLVMTATPIPRTLAMTLYGDLDTSVIDQLPGGRKPIQTVHRFEANRMRVYGFMKEQIALGRQVYVVYPLIEESEKLSYRNLAEGFESICRDFPQPQYHISMLHGKMKPQVKEEEMANFVKGITHIMVATTVIEVGVNVPNASVMVIESAEKFGLSQLHQLRGRVGRGAEQSYCILMTEDKLGNDARLRMKTMCDTTDGFKISEVDLELRGPGEIDGKMQSGIVNLKIADLAVDRPTLEQAREAAWQLLDIDPRLEKPENTNTYAYFNAYCKESKWASIS